MLEGEFSRKLLAALRKHPALAKAVIWKHNDASTKGIPDFSISIGRITFWFEVKMEGNSCTKLQGYNLQRLRDGGCLIVASANGHSSHLYMPHLISTFGFDLKELVEVIVRRCVNP